MRGDILKGLLWPLVSAICQLFKDAYCLLESRICSLLREWQTTRRNVILKCVFRLVAPPIYSWICEGYTNEDRRYALLFLAMEIVSLILDRLGGSHWGFLLASCLLSVLILETTIYAYFISRSRIKSQGQQLIVQEIVFSVLQMIFSCYCLIRTLSGAKTSYNSSWFPLASAIISVLFTLTSKNDVSHSSSDPPPNDPPDESVSIPMPTGDAKADPLDKSLDSVHKSDDKEDPLDKSPVSVPSTSASVPQTTTLCRRRKQSHLQDEREFDFELVSRNSYLSVETPPYSPSNQFVFVSGPTSDAEVDPLDEPRVSVPTSNAQVDPLDEPLVSVPSSSASIPQANTLRQRSEQSHFTKVVFRVNLSNDKAKKTAMRTVSGISGVDTISMDMKEQKLTVIGDMDPVPIVRKLRKQCYTEIISVGPAKQPKASEEKQSVEKKDLKEDPHPPLHALPTVPAVREDECVIC